MKIERREFLGGMLAVGACSPRQRTGRDVFAAGQPAAVLALALAPDRLIGWPRLPPPEAVLLLPGADLPQTGALASGGAPASFESVAAARPRLILDYGNTEPRYRAIAANAERRLHVPYRLIDGSLLRIPDAITEAALYLERVERGKRLSQAARAVLDAWSAPRPGGPRFYYARGADGLETGFRGSLATEVLEGAGWQNVAVGSHGIGRVSREQFAAWDPDMIVTLDPPFAARASASDPFRTRASGKRRQILELPALPFGWIDRPPSINRLLGCAWLARANRGAPSAPELASLFWDVRPGAAMSEPKWR